MSGVGGSNVRRRRSRSSAARFHTQLSAKAIHISLTFLANRRNNNKSRLCHVHVANLCRFSNEPYGRQTRSESKSREEENYFEKFSQNSASSLIRKSICIPRATFLSSWKSSHIDFHRTFSAQTAKPERSA